MKINNEMNTENHTTSLYSVRSNVLSLIENNQFPRQLAQSLKWVSYVSEPRTIGEHIDRLFFTSKNHVRLTSKLRLLNQFRQVDFAYLSDIKGYLDVLYKHPYPPQFREWVVGVVKRYYLSTVNPRSKHQAKLIRIKQYDLSPIKLREELGLLHEDFTSLSHYFSNIQLHSPQLLKDLHYFDENNKPLTVMALSELLSGLEQKALGHNKARFVSDGIPFIKLNTEYQWFKNSKGFSRQEGIAMGHCGNIYHQLGDVLYSLRERTKYTKWIPYLTFIVNNGILVESKGLYNEKPQAQFHQYILALLLSDDLKSASSSRYKIESDFHLNDLTTVQRAYLYQKKPSLFKYWEGDVSSFDNIKPEDNEIWKDANPEYLEIKHEVKDSDTPIEEPVGFKDALASIAKIDDEQMRRIELDDLLSQASDDGKNIAQYLSSTEELNPTEGFDRFCTVYVLSNKARDGFELMELFSVDDFSVLLKHRHLFSYQRVQKYISNRTYTNFAKSDFILLRNFFPIEEQIEIIGDNISCLSRFMYYYTPEELLILMKKDKRTYSLIRFDKLKESYSKEDILSIIKTDSCILLDQFPKYFLEYSGPMYFDAYSRNPLYEILGRIFAPKIISEKRLYRDYDSDSEFAEHIFFDIINTKISQIMKEFNELHIPVVCEILNVFYGIQMHREDDGDYSIIKCDNVMVILVCLGLWKAIRVLENGSTSEIDVIKMIRGLDIDISIKKNENSYAVILNQSSVLSVFYNCLSEYSFQKITVDPFEFIRSHYTVEYDC